MEARTSSGRSDDAGSIVPSVSPAPGWVDPVVEAYKAGVDRTLIRENLKLTHEQRIENLQSLHDFSDELRRAGSMIRRG